jgi:hypothetical protein
MTQRGAVVVVAAALKIALLMQKKDRAMRRLVRVFLRP